MPAKTEIRILYIYHICLQLENSTLEPEHIGTDMVYALWSDIYVAAIERHAEQT